MMQYSKIIASLFSNSFEHVQNMMQSKQSIASLFQTVLQMFEIWCNQNKLLHHYFIQFWTCSKYDAIKTNYCITVINAFKTSFYTSKRWCSQNKLLYHYFQIVLNIFKISCNQYKLLHHYFQTVLNMFQIWCNNIWTCSRGDAMKLNYCITFLAYVPWLSWPELACSNDIMT